jgi:hypothetical protein
MSAGIDTTMDLSAYLFNRSPGSATTFVRSFAMQEFDPAHNLVVNWRSLDHIPITEYDDCSSNNQRLGVVHRSNNVFDYRCKHRQVSGLDQLRNWDVGMLGVELIVINDPLTYCVSDGIERLAGNSHAKLIGRYDLLGRTVAHPVHNQILILHHDDGSSQRILRRDR